ncbi:hypothetical protein LIER_27069 [Lithospermum erythrorhizon]|uniref:Uncharacterized protein n=1 Tax=Lithospermum erythrorhizon TaxID=34254 RepID=A0AAV3RDY8_LITER
MDDNDDKIQPTSPYFLGSGDQPGNLITHVILLKENYSSCLDSKLAPTVPYFEDAKPLWDYLEKRFLVANSPRL